MKAKARRDLRRAVAATRCPGCNRMHLEILTIEPVLLLCSHCGWTGDRG